MTAEQGAIDTMSIIERLAHYLASGDAGDGPAVIHGEHVERAATILAILKDPDPAMMRAGDGETWRRMIDAALIERWSAPGALHSSSTPPPEGTDEEGDVRLTRRAARTADAGSWVQGNRS